MTIQERQGALWALQTVASSRYVREVTKVAMHIHVHPRITSDAIKALFWPDDYQFTVWLLPKSLLKRYACASCLSLGGMADLERHGNESAPDSPS